MAAQDNLNGEQLKMFMTPAEIKDYVTTSGDRKTLLNYRTPHAAPTRVESMGQLWKRKLKESKKSRDKGHGSGVYDALKEGKNILTPPGDTVEIHHHNDARFITDKHHRIAAQAELDRKSGNETFVPVSHYRNVMHAPKFKEERKVGPPKPQTESQQEQAAAITKHFL
jgi:hypothetical protein